MCPIDSFIQHQKRDPLTSSNLDESTDHQLLGSPKAEVVQVCAAMRGMQSSHSLSPDLSQNPRKINDLANYDLGIALAARAASACAL